MFSRSVVNKVVFALLLTMLMAWVGHTSALFTSSNQQITADVEHAHSHDGEAGSDAGQKSLFAGHFHTSFIADHVHETPHPSTQLALSFIPERSAPDAFPDVAPPNGPIFPIERPPRSRFAI